ncbi:hypothetical protein DI272_35250, partial [Streptomyces sp. Act143]
AGLRALDVSDVARFMALLDDPDAGVVREAAVALLPSAGALDEERLRGRLAEGRSRAVRVSAFRLFQRHGGLARLRAAVALIGDPDDRLRHAARQAVRRWCPAGRAAVVPGRPCGGGARLRMCRTGWSRSVSCLSGRGSCSASWC